MQSLPNIPPNAAGNDPTWFFNDFDEGKDKHRDPSAGEFYQEIDNFVREVIQNSLDARANKEGKPVRVLFSWGTLQGWKKDSFLKKCFEELLPHYKAWRKARTPNGDLEGDDVPTDCKFIVVEDFETIGLVGDVKRERVEGGKNHLYDFVRREGSSEKSENDRGRRGLGKQVFLSASQLSTFLFWTVRNDPQLPSLMMGVSTLGVHSVNGKKYHPDGWLVASRPKVSADGKSEFPDPITDPRLIETFGERFKLSRRANNGLSVVVPFACEDVYAEFVDKDRLAYRVIKEFYYPILAGQLEVEIKSPTDSDPLHVNRQALQPDSLQRLFEKVCESEAEKKIKSKEKIKPEDVETLLEKIEIVREYLATAKGANESDSVERIYFKLDEPERDELKSKLGLKPAAVEHARAAFRAGKTVMATIEIPVPPDNALGRFDVLLKASDAARDRKGTFIRNGLIISDVHQRGRAELTGVHAFVIIQDGPLGKFLGYAENPAHTKWEFRDCLPVSRSQFDTLHALISAAPQDLLEVLKELKRSTFSPFGNLFVVRIPRKKLLPRPQEKGQSRMRSEPGGQGIGRELHVAIWEVKRDGKHGFKIRGTYPPGFEGKKFKVLAGYRSRMTNDPLKAYKRSDFDFADGSFEIKVDGLKLDNAAENVIELRPKAGAQEGDEFVVEVTGFDPRRDVHCKMLIIDENEGA